MWMFLAFVLAMGAFLYLDFKTTRVRNKLLFLLGMARGSMDKSLAKEFDKEIRKL